MIQTEKKNDETYNYQLLEKDGMKPEDIVRRAHKAIQRLSSDSDKDYLIKLVQETRKEGAYYEQYNRDSMTNHWMRPADKMLENKMMAIVIGAPAAAYITIIVSAIIFSFFINNQFHGIDVGTQLLLLSVILIGFYSLFAWRIYKDGKPLKKLLNTIVDDIYDSRTLEIMYINNYQSAVELIRERYAKPNKDSIGE